MEIIFDKKFVQKDLDTYIEKYFAISLKNNDFRIVFNLEKLEWINSEEITFLFGWLKKLLLLNKQVTVKLPFSSKKFEIDDDETINRRKFLKYYMWETWRLYNFKEENVVFENYSDINDLYKKYEKYNFGKKVLPFQIIDTELPPCQKVDEKFYNSNISFNVDNNIIELLNENDCYSLFENEIISEIITKELFMNSAEHAETSESYFTAAFKGKWENTITSYFKEQFVLEKDEDTLHFYKDKKVILKKIVEDLQDPNKTNKRNRAEKIINDKGFFIAGLQEYNDNEDFKNQSFVEFTFIDFGKGIFSTLNDEYENNKGKYSEELSNRSENIDSTILECAFLLSSSKEPFDRRIDNEDTDNSSYANLIPRGLYFLIDMVRRYKGLLVARSGKGKVVYDFSDRIKILKTEDGKLIPVKERTYVAKDAVISCNNSNAFLQGTMISIILPERKNVQKTDVTIDIFKLNQYIFNKDNPDYYPPIIFEPDKYEYLSLSFLYNVFDTENTEIYNSKSQKVKSIFKRINQKLIELKGCNCVLFIDFEYLPVNENIFKILLFLSNSPWVNELTKVIILNLEEKEFLQLKAFERGHFYSKGTSFLYKPIPCLRLNKLHEQEFSLKDIQWIGVAQKEDVEVLSKLFFGSLKDNNIDIYRLFDKTISGNVLPKSDNRVYTIFADFADLISKAKEAKLNEIKNWILQEDNKVMINGEKYLPKRLFLTSKGTYQKRYLSFYEKLSFKYTAQYFAQYLLDKYIDTFINIFKKEHKSVFYDGRGKELNFYDLDKTKQDEIKKSFKFDKILAVTVSSQLLAIEIKNLIRTDERYSFLKIENEEPELIKLSSYFSFEDEKPLRSIEKNQEILIVNDVISTGSLIMRQMKIIKNIEGITKGILSIVDIRTQEEYDKFSHNDNQKIISIIASKEKNNSDFIITKYPHKPDGDYEIKRINPILNSIVTLNSKHAEKNKVLFDNPEELFEIPDTAFDKDVFQIGHFKQSLLSCSSYYTDMKKIFSNNDGKNLLQSIRNKMKVKYTPNFIFYPISSAIEEINEDTYYEVFGTNKANIIGLSRYETPYGWRFIFPPKRYNEKVLNVPIMIIDSGTLSGQSLLQLIDAISIYEVSRIDVLIVIGRLDDFQREFYSRIKKINVKKFDYEGGKKKRKTNKPINIYFGTNLHIPSYQAEDMCPFCKETMLLMRYKNDRPENLPNEVKIYIDQRLEEISLQKNHSRKTPSYIPKDRQTGNIDFKKLFLIRDELGKINNYRFYEDYFSGKGTLDDLCNNYPNEKWIELFNPEKKDDLRKFEQVLICLLHEPDLKGSIKDLLINLFDILVGIISTIMKDKFYLDKLNYKWSEYEVLRLYYTLSKKEKFYSLNTFENIFQFCGYEEKSLNYVSFLLWEPSDFKEQKRKLLDELSKKLYGTDFSQPVNQTKERVLIRNLLSLNQPIDPTITVKDALYNLKQFYDNTYQKNHDSLFRTNIRQINTRTNNNKFEEINSIIADHITEVQTQFNKLLQYLQILKNTNVFSDQLLLNSSNSVYNQLKQLSEIYRDIKDIQSQSDFTNNKEKYETQVFDKMRLYFNAIREFERLHLSPNSDFLNRFIANYTFEPYKIVEELFNSEDIDKMRKDRKNYFYKNNIEQGLLLEGRQCLQYVFREVIENSVKRQEHDNTIISFTSESIGDEIVITINQNKKYIPPNNPEEKERNGGFTTNVKNVMEWGFGRVEDNSKDENAKEYIIKLIFNNKIK